MRPSKAANEMTSAAQSSQLMAELEVDQMGRFPIGRIATVGRAPDSSVVLNARSVSRNHARIFYEGNHFWIKDLESANGTLVNGKKVTLQMLSDGDKLSFGEVKSVFHTSAGVQGPAALAKDPLAGIGDFFADGTPTGGLKTPFMRPAPPEPQPAPTPGPATTAPPAPAIEDELRRKIQALESENAGLREQLRRYREAPSGTASGAPLMTQRIATDDAQGENERLRRLVTQLERALADANLRLRNLQERLDRSK